MLIGKREEFDLNEMAIFCSGCRGPVALPAQRKR